MANDLAGHGVKWQVERGNYHMIPQTSAPDGWRPAPTEEGVWFPFAYAAGDAVWRRKIVREG